MRERKDADICVAQIGAAHGLQGEVRLRAFTERPRDFARYGPLQSEDGHRTLEVAQMREAKDHFIVRFAGIDDRNAAEALRNLRLYVPRERLPATEDGDTYYHADLIGLPAVTASGVTFGEIVAILNFGAGDILEVKRTDGTTAMLPFTEAAVPSVDIAGGKVVVDPPAEIEDRNERE